MLKANLFPLALPPEALRIHRYGHKEPQRLLGYLRAQGFLAEIHGQEVWAYGVEAPEARARPLGTLRPEGVVETAKAFNGHLHRLLAQKGFYRNAGVWLDPEDYVEITGHLALSPRGPKVPLPVRLQQGYRVEVVHLEGVYFALVDLEKQVFTKATLAELGGEVLQHLEALQERPPLRAFDPIHRKDLPLREAPPNAHLLLHPQVLAAIEAPLSSGSGVRRLVEDVFWESQFSFRDLEEKVPVVFQGVLDPRPWAIPKGRLASVTRGALRLGQGSGHSPKEVWQKGFFRPPEKVTFHLSFPAHFSLPLRRPAGWTHAPKARGQPERRETRPTHAEEGVQIGARELLLRHFVDRGQLGRNPEGRRLLALTPSLPSFRELWERIGASLELQRPPLVYDPQTGKAVQGGPLPADIALLLAPQEVALEVLQQVDSSLRASAQLVQWVQPPTLLQRPPLHELVYSLARKVGGIPFVLEGFAYHVLGIVHTGDGLFWRLLSPEGEITDQGWNFPEKGLPHPLVVHFRGGNEALKTVLGRTRLPLVRIGPSRLRFSDKALPLGTYFRASSRLAYLHAHPGHPGWPKALRVEVVQGDLDLEEAVAQVYWLTKVAGGLYHPNVLPLSVANPMEGGPPGQG